MKVATHLGIAPDLCGDVVSLAEGKACVRLTPDARMASDDSGLVHGGFVFGMADYAAMVAVNHPFVVLGAAESSFVKPVRVGETLEAEAEVKEESGKKRFVDVTVRRGDTAVFTGRFTCFVLEKHVLGDTPK